MNELALFAGAGGGILGGVLLGWNCIGACEIERYPREVLFARQRDGILPEFPIWDDVRTFNGEPWRGLVDVVSGGFPCQDISCAGKGVGIGGERSGLWAEMHRIICEVRPRFAFMENSPMLTSRGLGRVLGDLAEIGYDACWTCLSAADCGAPHRRERIWILAHDANPDRMQRPEHGEQHQRPKEPAGCRADGVESWAAMAHPELQRLQGSHPRPAESGGATGGGQAAQPQSAGGNVPDTASCGQAIRLQTDAGEHSEKSGTAPAESCPRCATPTQPDMPRHTENMANSSHGRPQSGLAERGNDFGAAWQEHADTTQPTSHALPRQEREEAGWWSVEPAVGRVADGVANRVDRLKALGNGQVPIVAAAAFRALYRQLTKQEYQP